MKEYISEKIVSCTAPDGFTYYYEVEAYKTEPESMHGNHAEGSLMHSVYGYSVGKKCLFEKFLPRAIRWFQISTLKIESEWEPSDVSRIYYGCLKIEILVIFPYQKV
ncbi:hypothetical protein [Moraxella bovis]|uniref:Uncharacterized protein n=3 Tax=Moraxella bovis TaxID=476 RepID=Q5KTA1_MORBO|nr:hypothetical protein [Moraxella bovis]BAD83719.1 hypothetical protein [Moraxella bovis Epp63]UYZ77078.1 hypothetical protein LP093_13865 [Moraxella bovis]UYZ79750.1 hypothetical protein LP115_13920 [Moraxella bovis]UYZ82536.1 hypothetical protein LP113_14530 [Moraxella bovis]UYZ88237.1 hypothetical protein LP094_13955 [Moraxella bovis]